MYMYNEFYKQDAIRLYYCYCCYNTKVNQLITTLTKDMISLLE